MPSWRRHGGLMLALAAGPLAWVVLALWLPVVSDHEQQWTQWRQLLFMILLYPLLEEWLFRGLIQGWLLETKWGQSAWAGITLANGAATLLFAVAHLLGHTLLWSLLVIGPSLIFGWSRERYRSVLPPVGLHIFYNGGYFLLFWPQA